MGTGGNEPTAENKTTVNGGSGDDVICICCCNIYCFNCSSMIKVLENGKLIEKKIS